jgi:hypothetical protein
MVLFLLEGAHEVREYDNYSSHSKDGYIEDYLQKDN